MTALHAELRRLVLETLATSEGRAAVREMFVELVKELPAAAPVDDTVSVEEAARIKKAPVATIYKWIQRGKLPCKRSGRTVRIPRGAL